MPSGAEFCCNAGSAPIHAFRAPPPVAVAENQYSVAGRSAEGRPRSTYQLAESKVATHLEGP
jgi:hypothetical protein